MITLSVNKDEAEVVKLILTQMLRKMSGVAEPAPEAIASLATFIDENDFTQDERVQIKFNQMSLSAVLGQIIEYEGFITHTRERLEYIKNILNQIQ